MASKFDFVQNLESRIVTPELVQELGNRLAEKLVDGFNSSGLVSRSGATVAALSSVGEPVQRGNGWSIGVMDASAAGHPEDEAPRGTLRDFFTDMRRAYPQDNLRPSPWKDIPQTYKDFLEAERRSGMYGGRGPDYANYLWVQDEGNARIYIPSHPYIARSVDEWKAEAPDIIERHVKR